MKFKSADLIVISKKVLVRVHGEQPNQAETDLEPVVVEFSLNPTTAKNLAAELAKCAEIAAATAIQIVPLH